MQLKIPASFWRGGTSRAVFFKEEDLAFYGLGGGISSLSKVGIIGRGADA